MEPTSSGATGGLWSVNSDESDADRVRGGETERVWYRSERIFSVDGRWYFHTREGVDVGPYTCQFDADLEAGLLLQKLQKNPQTIAGQVIKEHMLDNQGGAGALNIDTFTDYLVESGGVEILQREAKQKG